MFKLFKPVMLFLGATMLVVSLACNFPSGSNDLPGARIPVSEQSAQNLEDNISQVVRNIEEGKPISLVINESELSSLLVYRLEQQSGGLISDSQVYLRDGIIQYRGLLSQPPLSAPIEADIQVKVTKDGRLDYQVLTANAGPIGVPEELIDNITSQFDQALYSANSDMNKIWIENAITADGVMTILGRPR